MKARDITLIAMTALLLVIQKYIFSFIPNVSFTAFIIIIYSKAFRSTKTIVSILIFTIIDGLIFGSLDPIFTPFTIAAWSIFPLVFNTFFNNNNNTLVWATVSFFLSFVYGFIYIVPTVIMTQIDIWAYIISDIPFDLILGITTFIQILLLMKPTMDAVNKLCLKYK